MKHESESPDQSRDNHGKRPRLHKSTLFLVSLLVLLPWTLIAIPGTSIGGFGTTGLSVNKRNHGWPFVHLVSAKAYATGSWQNGVFQPGQLPPDSSLNKIVKDALLEEDETRQLVQPRLRLEYDRAEGEAQFDYGYWSELANWPPIGTGSSLELQPVGALLNLLVLAVLILIVGSVVEFRARKSEIRFAFSLRTLLFLMVVVGLVGAWGLNETSKEKAFIKNLSRLKIAEDRQYLELRVTRARRFPQVVSELLNHGRTYWGTLPFFTRVDSIGITCALSAYDDVYDSEKREVLAKALTTTDHPVTMTVSYCRFNEQVLNQLGDCNLEKLSLFFFTENWVNSFEDLNDPDLDEEALKARAGTKVGLTARFLTLKELELRLAENLDVRSQLEPFSDLPKLEIVLLTNVTESAARYLLETSESWPRDLELEFADDVSEDLQTELRVIFQPDNQ